MLKRLNLKFGTYNTEVRVKCSVKTIVPEMVTLIRVLSGKTTEVFERGVMLVKRFKSEHSWQLAHVSMTYERCEKVRLSEIPSFKIKFWALRRVPGVEG